ncbi:MAG TPA: FCD domain-containing protein [Syntrophorhabdaceae bacterium]|nr:FCD domain-containing protein [Syntrophorhabdaceae bacterium]
MTKRSDHKNTVRSKKQPLATQIVNKIKEHILSQKIPVGQGLPSERAMAKDFGVSRSVVREALRSLEQSGLVQIKAGANGGASVADNRHLPLFFSAYDLSRAGVLTLDQFYVARRVNECATIREACMRATAGDLDHLRQLNKKILAHDPDIEKARENHRAFHLAIAQIAGNPLLALIVHSLQLLVDTLCPATGRDEIRNMYKRHEAIIEALESRDTALCESLMVLETRATKQLNLPVELTNQNPDTRTFFDKFKLSPSLGNDERNK